jgi:hypothetical protein
MMNRSGAQPRSQVAAQRSQGAQAAFHEAIGRMEAIVDQETALLRENRAVELTEYNNRKQQGLLEINRILRNFSEFDIQLVDRDCIRSLVRKLEANRQILAHHLKAMDEISTLVSRAMQEAESDGTYGRGGA